MLSEISLTQKDKFYVFSHVWNLGNNNFKKGLKSRRGTNEEG